MLDDDFENFINSETAGHREFSKKYVAENPDRPLLNKFFPCELANYDGVNRVTISSPDSFFFTEALAKHNLYGNGYCWEGIIQQILEKENANLLNNISFESEADTFVAYLDTLDNQLLFADFIHQICRNPQLFDSYLLTIDKSRIDN